MAKQKVASINKPHAWYQNRIIMRPLGSKEKNRCDASHLFPSKLNCQEEEKKRLDKIK